MKFTSTLKLKLIYVFRINDLAHKGCLKIGEATCDNVNVFELAPSSKPLNDAAKKRINQYTQTAGIKYDLLYTELTIYNKDGLRAFNDSEVHNVLVRSGIKRKLFDTQNHANEWFETDLETVKKAIAAVKAGKDSLSAGEISHDRTPIAFRPEQTEAIEKTKKQFKKSNQMLWNAKMRFGKTLSALQVVKDLEFTRTLILTHRPVVDEGWFEDFGKIFYDRKDYAYGSRTKGSNHALLEQRAQEKDFKYVYFASMQDLRGSELVGGNFDKNLEIFSTPWDLIIVDEAHEGTQTELGKSVLKELIKENTKILRLSGTPFNLLDDFNESEIYTWDYVMEQRAKTNWDIIHQGDSNPYAALPKMNIFTYNLGKLMNQYIDADVAFNFHEFFRVDESGNFCHKKDITNFLNLITKSDKETAYPFSTEEYRNNFRHTLWMLPGVKEAKALSAMLQKHAVFQHFTIVNVAGDGDEEQEEHDALQAVKKAIGENPEETYTITLSCGRLTMGVSVPAWTAVLMLAGSYNTSASNYMQTIFRVQTPATINGHVKEECFVFDFAPDRTLKVIAETAKISAKAGQTSGNDRAIMTEFLNFCPIISIEGSQMRNYDTNSMLEQLKKVYVERVVRNGFEDNYLYSDKLFTLDEEKLKMFEDLKEIIGTTKAMPKTGDIDVNQQGFTDEQYEQLEEIEKKLRRKVALTEEELRLLEEKKEKRKIRDTAISILRGISIRMPLLIYGAELNEGSQEEEITLDNFETFIDEQSWEEFMPHGVTKEIFCNYKEFYDQDVFRAAGRRIRELARAADTLSIEDRIERIANIFSNFRNPDKETVLTPWRVVNMQLGDCLGGYNFFDETYTDAISQPRFIDHGEVTADVFAPDARILEINSKSGLYPLYMAYGIYRSYPQANPSLYDETTLQVQQSVWDKVVAENIFVICKTPMAKSITKRTLVGFRNAKVNTRYFEDLINQIKNKPDQFIEKIRKGKSYWKTNNNDNMKFNAIVGNPPYQVMDEGHGVSAKAVYNEFVNVSRKINPNYISMIMPSRWFAGGKGLDDFRESMLNDKHISQLIDFETSNDIFPGVDIAGGVCYFLRDSAYNGKCNVTNTIGDERHSMERDLNEFSVFIRRVQAVDIIKKIHGFKENDGRTLADIVFPSKPFGMRTFYKPKESGVPCQFIQKIGLKYADPKDVKDDFKILDKWKLLLPAAPIAGQTDFSKPVGFYYDGNVFIVEPGTVCTESFIVAGAFDTKEEVLSFKSYIFTKIARFLLLQAVISQHVTKQNFQFVPDLGEYKGTFTDEKLRQRWNITDEEWKVIDERIK